MDRIPPAWPALTTSPNEASAFWQRLRLAPHSLLLLDYDGTLAPFHEDRMQAAVYPGVEERLITLSALPTLKTVLVSGRSARELRSLLHPDIRTDIWGSHGRELLKRDGAYQLFELDPVQQVTLDFMVRQMTASGFAQALEIKPTSLAVHWRSCERVLAEQIRTLVLSTFQGIADPGRVQLLPFDGGVELRSTDRSKGTAVSEILSQESEGIPAAYLGDDLTDEDAFAALGEHGLSILVRPTVRKTCARFWLRPPEELLAFLDAWIAAAAPAVAGVLSVEAP